MANKQTEYNRGRMQGLDMAYRLLKEEGQMEAAKIIETEIRNRGVVPIKTAATLRELDRAAEPYKQCLYETALCMALEILHVRFGFGHKRGMEFMRAWNLKTDCLTDKTVKWKEYVEAIRDEMKIDVPTEWMRKEKKIWGSTP